MPPNSADLQTRLQTQDFWTKLKNDKQSEELLNVTSSQIENAKAFLTSDERFELGRRRQQKILAIRKDSVKRYPVQVPKSALTTFSDKYEEKISDSKRKREQRRPLSVLRRKKLNAEDVEKAESKYQDEKGRLLGAVVRIIEDSDSQIQDPDSKFLKGTTAADFMKRPDTTDKAAFLVDSRSQMETNKKVLSDETGLQECVRQFKELDLSADLRTDKALAKNADRLEKVTGKARAMINLVDRHPEIIEGMENREREEFQGKLDRAAALLNYYQIRKDIITDSWYRNHKNSEISMRFVPKPQGLTGEGEQLYLRQQNLTRKIWDAEQCAGVMDQYVPRQKHSDVLYRHTIVETNQRDVSEDVADWEAKLNENYNVSKIIDSHSENTAIDVTTARGAYFAEHYDKDDKVYQAVTTRQMLAGTDDVLLDMDRNYPLFANWNGLRSLSQPEFTDMMNNLQASNKTVTGSMTPEAITNLREQQLNALRSFKEVLVRETPYLQAKYGGGLRLEEPAEIINHESTIWDDMGNPQTVSNSMKLFEKYGILDETNPQDMEMKATMQYIMHTLAGAKTAMNILVTERKGKKQTYADTMRIYASAYQFSSSVEKPSDILGIRDLERKLQTNLKVQWNMKPPY